MASYSDKITKVLDKYINVYDRRDQLSPDEIQMIQDYTKKQPQITKTLYRGQKKNKEIYNSEWFSLSENEFMVKERFSTEGKCCVFNVHVINTPVIDVQEFSRNNDLEVHEDENEFIVIGDGRFFQNEDMTIPGFNEVKSGEYETWYTTMSDKEIQEYNSKNKEDVNESKNHAEEISILKKSVNDLFNEMKEDGMIDMIENEDDLKESYPEEISNLSQEEIDNLMKKIKEENAMNGGKKQQKSKKPKKSKRTKRKTMNKTKKSKRTNKSKKSKKSKRKPMKKIKKSKTN
jgi:hypothetical protein